MLQPFPQNTAEGRSGHPQFQAGKWYEMSESRCPEDIIACINSPRILCFRKVSVCIKLCPCGMKAVEKPHCLFRKIFKAVQNSMVFREVAEIFHGLRLAAVSEQANIVMVLCRADAACLILMKGAFFIRCSAGKGF